MSDLGNKTMNTQASDSGVTTQLSSNTAGDVNVLDLMIVVAQRKKLIIGTPIVVGIIVALISLTFPNTYLATTKLMPPQQGQSSASAMLSQLGGAAALAGVGVKSSSDTIVGMLQSRTIADRLIAKLDLKKVYQTSSQEQARARLEGSTTVKITKDGLISIEVEDIDKKMVAPLANAYVNELALLTRVIAVGEAGQRRVFYESQLEQAKDKLAKAEIAVKNTLDTRGVISIEVESQAVLGTIARVRAQVSAKEIELNSMRAFVTQTNPQYRRAEQELISLRTELDRLQNGSDKDSESNIAPDMKTQNGFENIKLLRDVKYYQMLYDILAKQYEGARLDEAKDPPLVQVLDPAVEPERKFKPHRALMVIISAMLAFFAAIIWAFAGEARRRLGSSVQGTAQLAELKSNLRWK